jgi:hypothetical protein
MPHAGSAGNRLGGWFVFAYENAVRPGWPRRQKWGAVMGWTLVVSEDDQFQREAIAKAGSFHVVGATGDASARGLVRAIDVERILVDALDDVGRRFLSVLRALPSRALPGVDVIVVGENRIPGFVAQPDIETALSTRAV